LSANREKPTIVVVGAGPAGSAAVLQLAQSGYHALLVEKAEFPRKKVCGDGIPGKVFVLLSRLGLNTEEIKALGFPIYGMALSGPQDQRVVFGGAKGKAAKSFCIPRTQFDHYLFRKASEQAKDVFTSFKAVDVQRSGNKWRVVLRHTRNGQEKRLHADILIAADGATSLLRRQVLNLKVDKLHRFWGLRQYFTGGPFRNEVNIIYDKRLLPGYAWVFPVSEHRANVGIMVEQRSVQQKKEKPLQTLFDRIIYDNRRLRRILKNAVPEDHYSGAPLPLGTVVGKRASDGFLAIGDAASFVNPATGGGVYAAVLSGMSAATIIVRAVEQGDWSVRALAYYDTWWQKQLLPGFKTGEYLRRLLRSQGKTNFLFNRMQKQGLTAALFVRAYGQTVSPYFWLHPDFWRMFFTGK